MAGLQDLKDRSKEIINQVVNEVQENSTFQSLREKYEVLPTQTQKIIVAASILIAIFFLLSIPLSYRSSSSDLTAEYEKNRLLIRNLLKASKINQEIGRGNSNISDVVLKERIKNSLNNFDLLPSQIGELKSTPPGKFSLAKPPIREESLELSLSSLNLNQVMIVGHRLQSLFSTAKVTGLDISPTPQKAGYFDVKFIISQFLLPEVENSSDKNSAKNNFKNSRFRKSKKGGQ